MGTLYALQDRIQSYGLDWPQSASYGVTPQSLAEAGFYYTPAPDAPDSATCFLCEKSLDGWTPADDALSEHVTHTIKKQGAKKGCPFAILKSGASRILALGLDEGKDLAKMRKATFGLKKWKWWAASDKPTTDALAAAGFYFTATEAGSDSVTCCWCELSLDGWEKGDDPLEEHQRRRKDCYMFTRQSVAPLKSSVTASASHSSNKTPQSHTQVEAIEEDWHDLTSQQPSSTKQSTTKKKLNSKKVDKKDQEVQTEPENVLDLDSSVEFMASSSKAPVQSSMSRSKKMTRLKSLAVAADLPLSASTSNLPPGRITRSGRTASASQDNLAQSASAIQPNSQSLQARSAPNHQSKRQAISRTEGRSDDDSEVEASLNVYHKSAPPAMAKKVAKPNSKSKKKVARQDELEEDEEAILAAARPKTKASQNPSATLVQQPVAVDVEIPSLSAHLNTEFPPTTLETRSTENQATSSPSATRSPEHISMFQRAVPEASDVVGDQSMIDHDVHMGEDQHEDAPQQIESSSAEGAAQHATTFMQQDVDSSQGQIVPIPSTLDLSIIMEEDEPSRSASPVKPRQYVKPQPSPLKVAFVSNEEADVMDVDMEQSMPTITEILRQRVQSPSPASQKATPVPVLQTIPNKSQAGSNEATYQSNAPSTAFQTLQLTEAEKSMSIKAWMSKLITDELSKTEMALRQRLVDFDVKVEEGRLRLKELGVV